MLTNLIRDWKHSKQLSASRGYSGARPDVVRLIQRPPERVLDIGCGAGLTAKLIQEHFPSARLFGIEPDPDLSKISTEFTSQTITASIEDQYIFTKLSLEGPFDLIICADVLEHLKDPSGILKSLVRLMKEDGYLITSLPNVRHISTFWSLGIKGTWPQRDRGIHDRTHLHFFARPNILDLMDSAGLKLITERRNLRLIESKVWTYPLAKLLDFWPFRAFFTFQYLHLWKQK